MSLSTDSWHHDSEQDEGSDLCADFEDAALTVRALNEDLHVAVEKRSTPACSHEQLTRKLPSNCRRQYRE
ncbi:hypothetical protein ABZ746_28815 [Streptomyces sp. NPDC020096]